VKGHASLIGVHRPGHYHSQVPWCRRRAGALHQLRRSMEAGAELEAAVARTLKPSDVSGLAVEEVGHVLQPPIEG